MRVVIDARLYGAFHRGIGKYVAKLSETLWTIDQQTEYILIVNPNNPEQPTNYPVNVKLVKAPWPVYSYLEQIHLPRLIKRLKPQVMHIPHFNVPLLYKGPLVVTIHDLIVHHFPSSRATTLPLWLYKLKLAAYKLTTAHAVRVARSIITISQAVADDIGRFYPRVLSKVQVIPLAPANLINTTKFLKLPAVYYLVVGAAYPHKNLFCALRAMAQVVKKIPEARLIIVGRSDYFMQQLRLQVDNLNLTTQVIFWGEASEEDLAVLYARATSYLLPSYLEGFGLGAVEAMRYQAPVIAADIAVLREVLQEGALFFDPHSHSDLAELMLALFYNKDIRESLKHKAVKVVEKYTWLRTAQLTKVVYQQVVSHFS